jgi:hypothetical protein
MLYQVCLNLLWTPVACIPNTLSRGKSSWSCHFNGLVTVHNTIVSHLTLGFELDGTTTILWVAECLLALSMKSIYYQGRLTATHSLVSMRSIFYEGSCSAMFSCKPYFAIIFRTVGSLGLRWGRLFISLN